jgi:hypothetical protein
MGEFQVLHAEPQYKVRSFATELLERRHATIQAMREPLRSVVIGMCESFEKMKALIPRMDLNQVIFAESKWTKEGYLDIQIGYGQLPEGEARYHIDELIAEIVDRSASVIGLRDELAQYLSGMVDQFTVLKDRHPLLDLRGVTFTDFKWLDGHLLFAIRHHGRIWGCHEAPYVG